MNEEKLMKIIGWAVEIFFANKELQYKLKSTEEERDSWVKKYIALGQECAPGKNDSHDA